MNISELFERHYPSLVWFLHGRVGDRDLAEDLAQEAFVRLIDAPPRAPDAWLYVVAGNLARDAQRGELRRSRHLAIVDDGSRDAPDPAPGADAEPCSAEESALVQETLALLPDRDAALLARAQQRFIRALGNRAHDRGGDARASS